MTRPAIATLRRLLLILALAASPPALAAETGDLPALRAEALSQTNRARADAGLPPLALTDILNRAAQRHAEDMLRRSYYGHASPEGDTVEDRYRDLGGSRWSLVAENIAECRGCAVPPTMARVREFHRGWMDSPPHRENILRRGLDGFGFGIVAGPDGRVLAVQTFAGPGAPRGPAQDLQANELTPAELAAQGARAINRERQREGLPPLQADEGLTAAASELLPEGDGAPFAGGQLQMPQSVDTARWRSINTLAAACGGCGTVPTAADVRYFADRWLGEPQYRDALLAPEASHIGFAMRAGGDGRKVAVAVIGRGR